MRHWVRACALVVATLLAFSSDADAAWVKDIVHLQLRTGAGNQFRIIGRIQTGDAAEILSRGDGWTRVRTAKGEVGWIPAGFLQPDPPSAVVLERLQNDAAALRDQVERLSSQSSELRSSNEELAGNDSGQRAEIERLARENYELRAGARWPEWITGSGIVLAGMAIGAVLSRRAGRRQQRIRL